MESSYSSSDGDAAGGYGTALTAFAVSALFLIDAFGEYLVNKSHLFEIGLWYEFAIATVAAAAGVILAGLTYY